MNLRKLALTWSEVWGLDANELEKDFIAVEQAAFEAATKALCDRQAMGWDDACHVIGRLAAERAKR